MTPSPVRAFAVGVALLTASAVAATTASAQTGSLVGTVMVDGVERPIAGADVVIGETGLKARTDSAGRFVVAGVPRGNHVVAVRALGFAPGAWKLTFTDGERVEIDFLLTATVQSLEKVEVKANEEVVPRISMRLTGFHERKALGFGHFIMQDVLEKAQGRSLTDVLLGRLPSVVVYVHPRTGRRYLVSNRRVNREPCYLRVLVDGMIQPAPFDVEGVNLSALGGVEFYNVATTPMQFNATGTAPCGTLLLWSKG